LVEKPKILLIGAGQDHEADLFDRLHERYDVDQVDSPYEALERLHCVRYSGIFVCSAGYDSFQISRLLQNERILEGMPDGVVLLDVDNTIFRANERFKRWASTEQQAASQAPADVVGMSFYASLGNPEILGPDICPAMATGEPSVSTLKVNENRFYHVHAAPIHEIDGQIDDLIVTVRDVTGEVLQQQKLAAIHQAGIALADLSPSEVGDQRPSALRRHRDSPSRSENGPP
jgi:PAS domain-containing protein